SFSTNSILSIKCISGASNNRTVYPSVNFLTRLPVIISFVRSGNYRDERVIKSILTPILYQTVTN
ncbi:MAG: hypothetical protein ACXWV1_06315, partial [Chitinophagaceae bacterium]